MSSPYEFDGWDQPPVLTDHEKRAWDLYCKDTAGSMDVRDYWHDLPPKLREVYLNKTLPPMVIHTTNPRGGKSWVEENLRGQWKEPSGLGGEERRYLIMDELTATGFADLPSEAWKRLEAWIDPAHIINKGVDIVEKEIVPDPERVKEVLKDYGPGARVVAPYKPNRKQRRAQNKIRRSKEKK